MSFPTPMVPKERERTTKRQRGRQREREQKREREKKKGVIANAYGPQEGGFRSWGFGVESSV